MRYAVANSKRVTDSDTNAYNNANCYAKCDTDAYTAASSHAPTAANSASSANPVRVVKRQQS